MEKNIVEYVLVIAQSPQFCIYYINNGTQRFSTYENIRKLITELNPLLALKIEYFLERHLSFLVKVQELEVIEIKQDTEKAEQQLRELVKSKINNNLKLQFIEQLYYTEIPYSSQKKSIIDTFFKRSKNEKDK